MLIKEYDIICMEDLQVKNMVRNHKLARNIVDVSWSEFNRILSYKAKWYGKTIVRVDKFLQVVKYVIVVDTEMKK